MRRGSSSTPTQPLRDHGSVLGIDAGFSRKRRTTGLCRLDWDRDRVDWRCAKAGTDREDRERVLASLWGGAARDVAAVAIDGPLRPGLEIDASSYRAAESVLSRGKFARRGKPGPTHAGSGPALHRAATELALLALRTLRVGATDSGVGVVGGYAVFEAFPNLFLGVLCDEVAYPQRPSRCRKWTDTMFPLVRDKLERLMASVIPNRELAGRLDLEDHEERAALVCALTALCAAQGELVGVGSARDGFIVLPPLHHWGRSASGARPWADVEIDRAIAVTRASFPAVERLPVADLPPGQRRIGRASPTTSSNANDGARCVGRGDSRQPGEGGSGSAATGYPRDREQRNSAGWR